MRAKGHWPKVPDLIWFSLKHHWADDVCVSPHITIKNIGHRFGLVSLDQLQGVWGRWTFVSCAILHVREAVPAPTCTDLFWWLPTPVCSLDPTQSSQALLCAWPRTLVEGARPDLVFFETSLCKHWPPFGRRLAAAAMWVLHISKTQCA